MTADRRPLGWTPARPATLIQSEYPWIEVETSTGGKGEMGWKIADCTLCLSTSGDNAEPYTYDWAHQHARTCHPRWYVRRGECPSCDGRHGTSYGAGGEIVWVIKDSRGEVFGCRPTFDEAIAYADHKAREFLTGELISAGWLP